MSDSEPIDPRRRIRELSAIPDRDRTDAEWDELNELEIRTAPGNRESGDRPSEKRANHPGQPRRTERNQGAKNGGQRGEARPPEARGENRPAAKRQHRRPKRQGGQGGQGGQGSQGGGEAPGNS